MAAVSKSGTPSLATLTPGHEHQHSGAVAGEDLGAGDACYIKSDGKIWKSTGAAANAAAVVEGFTPRAYKAGQACTIMFGVEFGYADGTLTPGIPLYLSGTTAGGLDTAPSTGGTTPVARVLDDGKRIFVKKSY